MEFHQIRYFLMAADHLNFTRAAEQCHVSQPALTRAIQKLEEELGGDLFVRDGRALLLSPLGGLMREHFRRIHATQAMARAAAKNFIDEGSAELNVGIMCTIGPDLLSAFLNEFRNRHRDVLLILHDIEPKALPELLLTGSLDCAFIARHAHHDFTEISTEELFEEDMVVAFETGHRFAGMQEVTLFDVAEETYVDRLNCEIRQPFYEFMDQNDLKLRVACSSQREDWIQELVVRGLGVSVMPRYSIITRRLGWRKLSGPLSGRRQITIARAKGLSPQPPTHAFFSDATTFPWQSALEAFEDDGRA
jgi:DNA-binding transcriptional LysR family regulator